MKLSHKPWHTGLTFANVSLTHEAPQEVATVVTVRRFVECLFDETVAVLVGKMIIPHWARRTGTRTTPTGAPDTALAPLWSHYVRSIPPFLNLDSTERSKLMPSREICCGQFHQRFTSSFCANILSPKKSNLSLSTEKLLKRLSYEKGARKMLVKLTPGFTDLQRRIWDIFWAADGSVITEEEEEAPFVSGLWHNVWNASSQTLLEMAIAYIRFGPSLTCEMNWCRCFSSIH